MFRALVLLLIVSFLQGGCASNHETLATIEVVDGCMVKIYGISSERAGEITKDWDFNTNCELEVKTRLYTTPTEDNGAERKDESDP